jgi:hypothetical protein
VGGILVGTPLKLVATQWTIVLASDESNTGGLFIGDDAQAINESLAQNAITKEMFPILVRGPALINKSVLPATDPNSASYTIATIVTALAALSPPIETMVEPDAVVSTTIQTT